MKISKFGLNYGINKLEKKFENCDIIICLGEGALDYDYNANKSFLHSRILLEKTKNYKKKFFCLSHKNNLSLVAYADFKIGADIEYFKPRNFINQTEFCFNQKEKEILKNANDKLKQFYKIFTTKEAIIKLGNKAFCDFADVGIFDCYGYYFNGAMPKFTKFYSFCFDNYIFSLAYH